MNPKSTQHGATLITALVMLVVLTLLVISAIKSSTTNMRIAGNMQMKEETIAAAQQGVEQIISNNFTGSPAASSVAVDINNDGATDYTAQVLKPVCAGSVALPMATPGLPSGCYGSGKYDPTVIYGVSNCSAQQWQVQASVTDPNTGATATVHQGVSLTVLSDTTC